MSVGSQRRDGCLMLRPLSNDRAPFKIAPDKLGDWHGHLVLRIVTEQRAAHDVALEPVLDRLDKRYCRHATPPHKLARTVSCFRLGSREALLQSQRVAVTPIDRKAA
jgi:hypothetical protein